MYNNYSPPSYNNTGSGYGNAMTPQQYQYYQQQLQQQGYTGNGYQQGYVNNNPNQNNISQPNYPTVRPVTSIEEVRATSIAFDGSISYFFNKANNTIYTKFIDLNGMAQIQTYKLENIPQDNLSQQNQNQNIDFVSREEFKSLQDKISKYEIMFNELMGGSKSE